MLFIFFFYRMYDFVGDKGNLINMILRNFLNFDNIFRVLKFNFIIKFRRISFIIMSIG